MLELIYKRSFKARARVRENYLAPFILEAAKRLYEAKYEYKNMTYSISCMVRFGNWLKSQKVSVKCINHSHIEAFIKVPQYVPTTTVKMLRRYRSSLKTLILVIHETYPPKYTVIQKELSLYADFLRSIRGLKEGSIKIHKRELNAFLQHFFRAGKINTRKLSPIQIRDYIEKIIPKTRSNSRKKMVRMMMSGYFCFLEMSGISTKRLINAIPSISSSRPAISPQVLSQTELDNFLDTIDRSTPYGKRVYATVRCLSDLGLRSCDVHQLTLDDINWREKTIKIQNTKRSTPFLFPLAKHVGEALADYILYGRPESSSRKVFLSHDKHHWGKPISNAGLRASVLLQGQMPGLPKKITGTHILRRSVATTLQQKGVSVKVIADFLGHASIASTYLYAQVDIPMLRTIAQPWPTKGGVR